MVLPVRLLMECVPEDVAAQRRERLVREAHEKDRQVSKERRFWRTWRIVLSTVPHRMLAAGWPMERLLCQGRKDG